MADNMVAGLFGLTPEMYGEQQRISALNEGINLAKLNPSARGTAMIYGGAKGLGSAIGGLMGVEDPQMKIISARQSIIGQLDQTNPTSMLEGIKMLAQMGDQQGAFALADYARKAQSEIALAQQRMREKAAADPFQKLVESGKYTTPSLAAYRRSGLVEDLELVKPEKAEPKTSYGPEADRVAKGRFGVNFSDLTQAQAKEVDDILEERGIKKAKESASKLVLPGQPVEPKDWMAFDQNVLSKDPTMQRTSTILSDAPSAIEIIRSSTTNDISAATLPGALARLTGEGKNMSNADVNRYARTGGLDDRLAQDAVKFFTGRTTDVKKDQAERFAIALYRGALIERKKKLEDAAEQYGYSESPNYKVALRQIDTQLGQFKLVKKGETTPPSQKTGNPLVDKWLSTDAEKK
jgi:hypothetical protein